MLKSQQNIQFSSENLGTIHFDELLGVEHRKTHRIFTFNEMAQLPTFSSIMMLS